MILFLYNFELQMFPIDIDAVKPGVSMYSLIIGGVATAELPENHPMIGLRPHFKDPPLRGPLRLVKITIRDSRV